MKDLKHPSSTACTRLVRPARVAVLYLNPDYAPYKMRIRPTKDGGWATFYKGRRKVWECNATFAEKNFDEWSDAT